MSDSLRGLYGKYVVRRRMDREKKHTDCRFFVLDLTHDSDARAAAVIYAAMVADKNPQLSADLVYRVGASEEAARE